MEMIRMSSDLRLKKDVERILKRSFLHYKRRNPAVKRNNKLEIASSQKRSFKRHYRFFSTV
jgi:hypothetical protein